MMGPDIHRRVKLWWDNVGLVKRLNTPHHLWWGIKLLFTLLESNPAKLWEAPSIKHQIPDKFKIRIFKFETKMKKMITKRELGFFVSVCVYWMVEVVTKLYPFA